MALGIELCCSLLSVSMILGMGVVLRKDCSGPLNDCARVLHCLPWLLGFFLETFTLVVGRQVALRLVLLSLGSGVCFLRPAPLEPLLIQHLLQQCFLGILL